MDGDGNDEVSIKTKSMGRRRMQMIG